MSKELAVNAYLLACELERAGKYALATVEFGCAANEYFHMADKRNEDICYHRGLVTLHKLILEADTYECLDEITDVSLYFKRPDRHEITT